MALGNGVLVHGPTRLGVRGAHRRRRAEGGRSAQAVLAPPPSTARCCAARRGSRRCSRSSRRSSARCPEAQLPMERPRVLASMLGSAFVLRGIRASDDCGRWRASWSTASLSLAPAALALRGGELAAYHGAEHVSIGSYEHGEARPKEHERCGSHLVGPILLTTAIGNFARRACARVASARPRASPYALGAIAASVEIFGWMTRNADHPLSRALAKPGHELQHRLGTQDPTPAQLEVAEAALQACLQLEKTEPRRRRGDHHAPATRPGRLRPARREDAGGLVHGRVLQPHARDADRGRAAPDCRHAGLPEARRVSRRDGRGARDPQALRGHVGRPDRARAVRRRLDRAVRDR